jgi:hypothetical protein
MGWASKLLAASGLVLSLGACSSDSIPSMPVPKFELGLADPRLNNPAKEAPKQRVVTAADLIGANGYCAGEAAPQALNFTAGPQAGPTAGAPPPAATGPAPAHTGVALGMTECEVVRALGHTDRIEVSTDERGQRSVTLTYAQGERAGVYHFAGGLLVSLERSGEPPAPAKPAKPKKAAKKEPPA